MSTITILEIFAAFLLGGVACFLFMKLRLKTAEKSASELVQEAKRKIERERNQTILKAKEEWLRTRDQQESEIKKRAEKLDELEAQTLDFEKKVSKREEQLKFFF